MLFIIAAFGFLCSTEALGVGNIASYAVSNKAVNLTCFEGQNSSPNPSSIWQNVTGCIACGNRTTFDLQGNVTSLSAVCITSTSTFSCANPITTSTTTPATTTTTTTGASTTTAAAVPATACAVCTTDRCNVDPMYGSGNSLYLCFYPLIFAILSSLR